MFDKEKVLQLRDLTGFGLKMAREVKAYTLKLKLKLKGGQNA